MAITINEGTQSDILTTTIGGTETGLVRIDVGVGTTRADFGGTITTVDALTNGTVRISIGTITTGSLTNIAQVHNAGTLAAGTNNIGDIDIATGTVTQVTTVSNLTNGSVNILTGTVTALTTVTTLSNLTNGSINILTGTVQNSGTTTGVGVVSNLTNGSVNILTGSLTVIGGTVGGAVASGAAASGNPNIIGGTDSGGSVYSMLVDTAGNPQVDVVTIPQVSVGTIPQVSVGTLPTLNLTTGTITTGSLANIAQVHNAGTLAAGANNIGDVDIATGTVTLLSTVTTVSNLTSGSVRMTVGTVTTGSLSNVAMLNAGTVIVSNLVGGTVRLDPTSVVTPLTFGTLGTAGGSFFATISTASGAGTKHYISGLQVVGQAGTADVRILAGTVIQGTGVIAGGQVVPAGGFARDFSRDFQTGTNSELTYHFVGAGTAFITINYWKGA